MSWFSVDVEADGPAPGEYSMVSFGVVRVDRELETTYYGKVKPISQKWVPQALAVSGHTRDEINKFRHPRDVMLEFLTWVDYMNVKGRPMFISDNNGFDWQFMNYYLWRFARCNPFGHSSTNLGSLYKGISGNMFDSFKYLRKTKHDHHPVNDAKSNAEAILALIDKGKIKGFKL